MSNKLKEVLDVKILIKDLRKKYFNQDTDVLDSFLNIFKDYDIELIYKEKGAPIKKVNGKYIITVPNSNNTFQNNFVIACELGKILLNDENKKHVSFFASELLMPSKQFKIMCKEHDNDPFVLSTIFSVTPNAIKVRMYNLGLIKEFLYP